MNKNEQSHSGAIESHLKRSWYKRILYAQKGRVDTRFGNGEISITKK